MNSRRGLDYSHLLPCWCNILY